MYKYTRLKTINTQSTRLQPIQAWCV